MSDATKAFDFSQFVPGFDFLKNLAKPAGSGVGAVPGMPSLSSWVAPTLSVEEVDKRITELRAVQYWLEQNGHALKATIQALEVQKMTLSTLRGMNVRMEDLANAFTRSATIVTTPPAAAPAPPPPPRPAPAPVAQVEEEPEEEPEDDQVDEADELAEAAPASKPAAAPAAAANVIDPLQWWGALTQQFSQIAATALQDAAKLGAPPGGAGTAAATKKGAADAGAARVPAKKAAKKPARKAVARKTAKAAVRKR